jgi:ferrochelatase
MTSAVAVLLAAHGTVDSLDDLPAFLTNVRRGHPPSPQLVAELRRRYAAIGGTSPLNAINAEVARKLERRLGVRVAWANRLWKPTARERLEELAREGVDAVALVALAQYSAHVYADDAREPAAACGIALASAPNWGSNAKLCDAVASRIARTLSALPASAPAVLVMTAHSLPQAVVDAGDPYEREVHDAAVAVERALRAAAGPARVPRVAVAFQSQGLSAGPGGRPMPWLGPDLKTTLDEAAAAGEKQVVFAPIGFLADHVEVLYDLDIEARALAAERGLAVTRVPSLNADDDFIDVLADVVRPVLRELAPDD